ncbi:hypothetical protein TNCV_4958311 [Trichonephila clavipes]|nr:hypothetical protein TNCV_4958311 [Trichonephila clavipes]
MYQANNIEYPMLQVRRLEGIEIRQEWSDFRATESGPVDDETDEDEDSNNESCKGPSNAGRTEAYRHCSLSYHSIAARVGRDPMTVNRISNQWVQDGTTDGRAGSQLLLITSS